MDEADRRCGPKISWSFVAFLDKMLSPRRMNGTPELQPCPTSNVTSRFEILSMFVVDVHTKYVGW